MPSELLPGENLVLKAHQHWIVIVKSVVVPVVLLVVVAILDLTYLNANYVPHLRTILSLAAIAIAGLWLIVVWVRWQATSYTLTDQRINIETGVFTRSSQPLPLDPLPVANSQ